MTLRAALTEATQRLSAVSDTPRLDAELLAAYALNIGRGALLLSPLDLPEPFGFAELIARRMAHEPIAYITGQKDFWNLTLHVGPGVLIPRPDSETLIEAAIAHFGNNAPRSILDLGAGSGALLLAALSHWPGAAGIGVDLSDTALEIAQANADWLGFGGRSLWRKGNWADDIEAEFDLILCNPPYVEIDSNLPPDVRDWEPAEALFAGPDGLDDYRILAPQITQILAPEGLACIEIGHDQAAGAVPLFEAQGFAVTIRHDLGQRDRCLCLTR